MVGQLAGITWASSLTADINLQIYLQSSDQWETQIVYSPNVGEVSFPVPTFVDAWCPTGGGFA